MGDNLHYNNLRQLCEQISECVNAFEPLFPEVHWSSRAESWTTHTHCTTLSLTGAPSHGLLRRVAYA